MTSGLTCSGWLLVTQGFAARIGISAARTYPIVRQRDGALVKWFVRDIGFLDVDGAPL